MNESLATKDDIKLLHDRLNNLIMLVVGIGFLNFIAVVIAKLL